MLRQLRVSIALAAALSNPVLFSNVHAHPYVSQRRDLVFPRDTTSPDDYSVIKNFAALGDSYAAGLGAGTLLTSQDDDTACSRYDNAYSIIMNSYFNEETDDGRRNFQFYACSQATTEDVFLQLDKLRSNSQDLVTMSAGGNDVGFGEVLKKCVYGRYSDTACNESLEQAESDIKGKLAQGVEKMLDALDGKLRQGGIVVYTLYGRFFNKDTDICDDKTWNLFDSLVPGGGPKLTKEKRGRMNDLVSMANDKITEAVNGFTQSVTVRRASYVLAGYDEMIGALGGRFCEDTGSQDPRYVPTEREMFIRNPPGYVPDQKKLVHSDDIGSLEKLGNETLRDTITTTSASSFKTLEIKSINHGQEVRKRLPDEIARAFHPNQRGHSVIAMAAIAAWEKQRAVDLGVSGDYYADTCPIGANPERGLTCTGAPPQEPWDSKPFVTRDAIVKAAREFCEMKIDSSLTTAYNTGLSDALVITLDYTGDGVLSESDCQKGIEAVFNDCDKPDAKGTSPFNPLDWKYGGTAPLPKKNGYIGFEPSNKWHEEWFCNGVDFPKYLAEGNAFAFVQEFCKQAPRGPSYTNFTLAGYEIHDTLDHVEYNVVIPEGYAFSEEQCNLFFNRLVDGCDHPHVMPKNNWKHGGTLDVNGVHLEINPKHLRHMPHPDGPESRCRTVEDKNSITFRIDGIGFATSDNGWSHGGLHERLESRCGQIEHWSFNYHADPAVEDGWEWEATAQIKWNGEMKCAEFAIVEAGGAFISCQPLF